MGIARNVLRSAHTWAAASMCVLVFVHLILNCRQYIGELKSLFKRREEKKL